ncbi:DUF6087 family protein [Kitasatospora kifunensis]|uniref:Uncharacterized protein n=1 Tax=Kitasatospora kifunensis TaxID=58351 RepID=A0A7W7RAK9_KITKI|nr:DUF6087 family protein [Kitasatospora kifunensis]MBB4928340.1 hypothetical protein [Kitasatospora kifunensis]
MDNGDEDEPLEVWAQRRAKRLRPVGQLKVVTIGHEDAPAHLQQHLPRLVSRWDGVQWIPQTIAENYAAAQRILHGIVVDGVMRDMMPAAAPRKAPGRHRRP